MPFWRLHYHLVWGTKDHQPLITSDMEHFLYRMLRVRCFEQGGHAFAVNGMADHVHVVGIIPPKSSVSGFVKGLKGSTSRFVSLEYLIPFNWQEGYGAFTVSERNLERAIHYVERQKEHHRSGKLIARLERMSSEDDGPTILPPN